MSSYWTSLSGRERALVIVAGLLLAGLLLILGIVRPLIAYSEESDAALAAATRTYQVVASAVEEARHLGEGAGEPAQALEAGQSARVVISVSARGAGVVISRIQPTEAGALTMWMDNVGSQALFGWLTQLEEDHAIVPDLVSVQRTGNGSLRAQVQFPGAAN